MTANKARLNAIERMVNAGKKWIDANPNEHLPADSLSYGGAFEDAVNAAEPECSSSMYAACFRRCKIYAETKKGETKP